MKHSLKYTNVRAEATSGESETDANLREVANEANLSAAGDFEGKTSKEDLIKTANSVSALARGIRDLPVREEN